MESSKGPAKYRANQIVYAQGDPADSVYFVQTGTLKVCVLSDYRKEAVVALLGGGDCFGEGCLTGQPLRLATVLAMTDCVITRIDKAAMVSALRDEPELFDLFMAYISARNARVEEDLVDQAKSAWRKISR